MDAAIRRAQEAIGIGEELSLRAGLNWAALVELAAMHGFLGDYARAIEYAERAIATSDPEIPARVKYPKAVLASLNLQRGQRAEAEAVLASSEATSFENLLRVSAAVTFPLALLAAQAELALAQNDAGRALTIMNEVIESAGRIGILVLLPPALHLRAKALLALGRADEAHAVLLDARIRAEATQARYRLLPILITQHEWEIALGHPAEAEAVRLEACEVATYIAEHAPADLRPLFLSLPAVRAVIDA
jgi:tetratricopeptide (TPR) repeat protein